MAWRVLFFLLVFANLVFYAWAEGYLGAREDGREPERLSRQLQAEKVKVLRPEGPPASAVAEAAACRRIAGLGLAEAEALAKAATAAGWEGAVQAEAPSTQHLVLMGDLASVALAERKAAELRQLGVTEFSILALDGGRREILLGRHPTAAAAQEALAALGKKGVKSARVESREAPGDKARVDIRAPADALAGRLPELIGPYAGATVGDCPAP